MFESIAHAITGFLLHNNNPLGLTLLALSALVEYIFPPFPGDTVTLFGAFLVIRYGWNLPWVFAAVMLGSAVGAMTNFYFGVWLGKRYRRGGNARWNKVRQQVERVIKAFERHGEVYVVLNRFLPAVRAVFFVAAGMARLRPSRVFIYAMISAAAWNTLVIGVGYAVGANWDRIRGLFRTYSTMAWIGLSIVAIFFIGRWLVRRKQSIQPGNKE